MRLLVIRCCPSTCVILQSLVVGDEGEGGGLHAGIGLRFQGSCAVILCFAFIQHMERRVIFPSEHNAKL